MSLEIVQALSDAHRNMERVLMLIRFQVDSLQPEKDESGLILLRNALGYMHNFPGVIHHPTEEIIYSRLTQLAPDTVPLCAKLREQHRLFGQQETSLLHHIRNAQIGELWAYRLVKETAISYCQEHALHIVSEDDDVLPQAVKCLRPEDWRDVASRCETELDPVFGRDMLQHYESLYDYLMSANGELNIH